MDEEIQEVRDNFYVGNYVKAMNLCESLKGSSELTQGELGAILARCCLAIPQIERLKAMQNSEISGQRAAALMAVITKSKNEPQVSSAKERLGALAKETQDMSCAMLHAIVLAMDGNWNEAAQMTKAHPVLEMQVLTILLALSCNQISMGEKLLKEAAGNNDDSAAYRIAAAAVKLGGGDPEEAYLTYCDLSSQFPPVDGDDSGAGSVLLQNGKAVANMQRGMFSEAVEDLQRALAVAPNDPDTLVNMCSCMTHLGKKEEFQQYYTKLEQVAPTNGFVLKTQAMSTAFTRFKTSLQAFQTLDQ
ncbi:unnamed protein product [Effrenium voratum]|uniref:Coatomer subunit epsilon n=1 Tax=Effrenium voratum TaxID=2562239 RepID=A0AA36JTX4_9DINO|nr:unnamed protein product [Effrenium voratum]CAJ1411519.1 unnamed protein product [Effrenium voratum]CAJ1423314.1 unnamed protein product [Effrenium voratum]